MTAEELKKKAKRVANGYYVTYEFSEMEFDIFCKQLFKETADAIHLKYQEMDELLNDPEALGEYLSGI